MNKNKDDKKMKVLLKDIKPCKMSIVDFMANLRTEIKSKKRS